MNTVTIVSANGSVDVSKDDPRIRAYDAIQKSIRKIARAQYSAAGMPKGKPNRPAFTAKGAEVRALVQASSDVLSGKITPEHAMALLLDPSVMQQRFLRHPVIRDSRRRTR